MTGYPMDVLPLFASSGPHAALAVFLVYTLAVFGLAYASNRLLRHRSFLSEYFLGSRRLGVWAFALTFAATSASGGSFTGFPSKIYAHGWILGLWIGSYIVVPVCAMGLLGKRLNQVGRISGAITIPDIFRDRFQSARFGLLAVSLLVFFMSFNLVAQFKAGSMILKTLLGGVGVFKSTAIAFHSATAHWSLLKGVDPEYVICLFTFGVAVIAYTTYGGFHAVVWTDVLQGIVMVLGVALMLPLAISQVGGLEKGTREMARMRPPQRGTAVLSIDARRAEDVAVSSGTWVALRSGTQSHDTEAPTDLPRLFRVLKTTIIPAGTTSVKGVEVLELKTPADVRTVVTSPHSDVSSELNLSDADMTPYAYGSDPDAQGVYVTGPGPSEGDVRGFLPLSLAFSFFFMWAISGTGQPSTMVRLMAFKDTTTLRRSMFAVAIYYSMIYFPLVIIFCCARILLPGMDAESDEIMPAMAVFLTENVGIGWLAGLLVAAPFAAVMSTVDSFLLMISSALVRDIYQRNINPGVSEKTIRRWSYLATVLVGTGAMLGAMNPPQFLQDLVVYTGSGLAACFLGPAVYALYWPRANTGGCMSGMLAGFAAHLSLYVAGAFVNGSFFRPYQLLNLDPIIVGLLASFAVTYIVTRLTPPPPEALVRKYFYKR